MDYSKSWTQPGQGYDLKEAVKINQKPDNPNDKVGDATNRRTEYAYIYVDGLKPAQIKDLVVAFNDILDPVRKWLKKDVFGSLGKNRRDVALSGRMVKIYNSKLGHLGGSQPDVVMVSKSIGKWVEANGGGNVKIGSLLNKQS
tara:strand:+ start:568 stop:996 length:429 start_codon:yes stop_codon:yes gene_type:complete